MAIVTRDGLIAAVGAGQEIDFFKGAITGTSGRYMSLFRAAGRPGAAATPSTAAGAALTSATVGALPFTNPPSPQTSYLAQLGASSSALGSLIVYDRLVETGALSGTVTGAQTVGSAALPARAGSGQNVALWLEIFTATGSTSVTVTASYTNQSGTSGRTATLIGNLPSSPVANTMFPFGLQSGDTGVQSVQSVTLSATTGTAGAFGIVLLQRVAEIPLMANMSQVLSWADLGLPQVKNDACLALMCLASGTTPNIIGSTIVAQG